MSKRDKTTGGTKVKSVRRGTLSANRENQIFQIAAQITTQEALKHYPEFAMSLVQKTHEIRAPLEAMGKIVVALLRTAQLAPYITDVSVLRKLLEMDAQNLASISKAIEQRTQELGEAGREITQQAWDRAGEIQDAIKATIKNRKEAYKLVEACTRLEEQREIAGWVERIYAENSKTGPETKEGMGVLVSMLRELLDSDPALRSNPKGKTGQIAIKLKAILERRKADGRLTEGERESLQSLSQKRPDNLIRDLLRKIGAWN